MKNWLTMFAEQFLYHVPLDEQGYIIKQIEQNLSESRNQTGERVVDYVRVQVTGKKTKI